MAGESAAKGGLAIVSRNGTASFKPDHLCPSGHSSSRLQVALRRDRAATAQNVLEPAAGRSRVQVEIQSRPPDKPSRRPNPITTSPPAAPMYSRVRGDLRTHVLTRPDAIAQALSEINAIRMQIIPSSP